MSKKQDLGAIKTGLTEINRALKLDPDFAAAWSLKAVLLLQQYWLYDTDPAIRDAAWDAIQSGRVIDPTLPELDLAEGYYYYWGYRDYAKALPFMQSASAALPNNERVHQARAYVLRRMGDWEGALAAMRRASELDPRNVVHSADIGETLTATRRFKEATRAFAAAQAIDRDDPVSLSYIGLLHLQESGDINSYSHLSHLTSASSAEAQLDSWQSALYLDDFETALQDVADWQEGFLDTKDYRVTRPMLAGLTHRYAGQIESATPLLRDARQEFETLLQDNPGSYAINRSLCFITGGLGEWADAKIYCHQALQTAPKDAFLAGTFKFDAAAGLALAGDAQGAVELLQAMLDADAGPTIYPIMYHPAFDGIRPDPIYTEFMKQYAPEEQQ